MLEQPMNEKLLAMRLHGMADALKAQEQDQAMRELSFLERLALLVDQQWNWRCQRTAPATAHARMPSASPRSFAGSSRSISSAGIVTVNGIKCSRFQIALSFPRTIGR